MSTAGTETPSPADAWRELAAGNERFVGGTPAHPHQDGEHRAALAGGQHPHAALLACSDSRVPPELVFDRGLGDLFTVRNAGQVVDGGAVASLEYAVAALGVPLIVVLAHDRCGAVRAAVDGTAPGGGALPPHIATHVAAIRPAIDAVRATAPAGPLDAESVGSAHLDSSIAALLAASELIASAVAEGTVGVVGVQYRLATGSVQRRVAIGSV